MSFHLIVGVVLEVVACAHMIGDRKVRGTRCADDLTGLSWYGIDSMGFKYWVKNWELFWKPYENYVKKVSRKQYTNREDKSKIS